MTASARQGALKLERRTGASSTAGSAARNANAFLRGLMVTNMSAHVTGTSSTRSTSPSALELLSMS